MGLGYMSGFGWSCSSWLQVLVIFQYRSSGSIWLVDHTDRLFWYHVYRLLLRKPRISMELNVDHPEIDRRLSVRALTNNLFTNFTTFTVRVNVDNTGRVYLRTLRKSVLNGRLVSIFLVFLFCDYTMYIFLFQTSSLVSFNVCFSLVECPMTSPFRFSLIYLDINPPTEASSTLLVRGLVQCDRQTSQLVFFKCRAYSNPFSSPVSFLSLFEELQSTSLA